MTVLGDWHVLVVMLFWCVAFQCFDDSRIKISNKCRYMFAVCDDFASAMPCAAAGPSRSRHVHGSMTGLQRFTICLCTSPDLDGNQGTKNETLCQRFHDMNVSRYVSRYVCVFVRT
jgi:hypothetical protein